jgi:hypothetical protein
MKWLKRAFAVDAPQILEPNESQRALIDKLCGEIVRRRLSTPALFMLEMSRPLNYVSAQFLHFIQPIAGMIADADAYREITDFLEQRGSIEYICRRLEAMSGANASPPGRSQ